MLKLGHSPFFSNLAGMLIEDLTSITGATLPDYGLLFQTMFLSSYTILNLKKSKIAVNSTFVFFVVNLFLELLKFIFLRKSA